MSGVTGIPANGVGSLSTLLKRLEAATARLEDIAVAQTPTMTTTAAAAVTAPTSTENKDTAPAVAAFEELIQGALAKYLALSNKVGGVVAEQSQSVRAAFQAQKEFVAFASSCTPLSPASPVYATMLGPTQSALMATVEIKEKNRASPEINLLSTVAEGIPALGWVTLDSKPGPYVGDIKESAQFYSNRVVKDFKETNPTKVEWARSFVSLLEDLRKYIMQHHTTALSWNTHGTDPAAYVAKNPPSSGSAPPAPSAPAATPAPAPASTAAPPAAGMGGIFAALNKGEGVTQGLKKVDKSEMTHKNPELRGSSVVPAAATSPKVPQKPTKPSAISKKLPKCELDGNKWNVENYENDSNILIASTEINQIINVFNVKSSVITIKGKVNAISLVNCTKTSVLLDSTVSSLAISTSPSFTVQILGEVPTILIDGTDGGQIYLSKDSLGVEIISAKSSSINVSLPVEGEEEGIFEEKAVPEQFKTVVVGGKLVTTVVEHSA